MSAQANHWKLGLFVVGAVLLTVGTLLWVGANRLNRETVRFHCYFDETVQGLEIGAPAKMRGVTIGTVAGIGFAPDRRHVDVQVDFYVELLERLGLWPLDAPREGEDSQLRVQLGTTGITGTKYLAMDFVDAGKVPLLELPFDAPTASLPTMPSTLKSIEDGITALTDAMPRIVDTIEQIGGRLLGSLEQMKVHELSDKAVSVLDDLERVLEQLDDEELPQRTGSLLAELEETLSATRGMVQQVDGRRGTLVEALDAWTALAGSASAALDSADLPMLSSTVRETAGTYRGLAVEATSLTSELHSDLAALSDSLRALRTLVEYLERNPSSLLRGRQTPEGAR